MTYIYAILVLSLLGGSLSALLLIADRFLADYGPCRITINEREPFIVDGGCTLFNALYEQRIFIPSACGGQGTCGFCKVNVLDGGGPVLPTELPFLSKAEIAADTRLACQVKVKQALVLHIRPDYFNIQQFRAVVTAAKMLTHDTREILLELIEPQEIVFHPGQYIQVEVPSTDELTVRAYSVCSPPGRKSEIELVVRLIPGGLGSTYLHNVEINQELTFTGPYGEFVLDDDIETELICVAGGCGIAPMRSLIRHIYEVSPHRKCRLFFGVRKMADVMYMEEFQQLASRMPNFQMHYALSEPKHSPQWKGETGFIHQSVAKHLEAGGRRQVFLCGPPLMVEATLKVLDEKEVSRDRIFYDEF